MVDCPPERQYNYYLTTTGTAMKTNRELNTEHDAKEGAKVRPKQPSFNYKPLEAVIRQWILASK